MWFRGVILKTANSPPRITARRGGGVIKKIVRSLLYERRRGGVPCPIDRNTTPSSRKADAAQYFLDRSATPPRGDARRGIRHFENSPELGQQCLEGGEPRVSVYAIDTPRMPFFFISVATNPETLISPTNCAIYLAAASWPFGTPTACCTTVKWPSSRRVPGCFSARSIRNGLSPASASSPSAKNKSTEASTPGSRTN